jgi:hypothetical protein
MKEIQVKLDQTLGRKERRQTIYSTSQFTNYHLANPELF